jgi:KipI family sensor histidine kinase inhibitor
LKTSNSIAFGLDVLDIRVEIASDCSLIIYVDAEKAGVANANELIRQLTKNVVDEPPFWLREYIPSYNTLLLEFDLDSTDHIAVKLYCNELIKRVTASNKTDACDVILNQNIRLSACPRKTNMHRIPVCYELSSLDSDLSKVAMSKNLTEDIIVKLHCSVRYRVYATGFLPGFAYLGELPLELSQPRLDSPRLKVPAGAVAIADQQTAIYPLESPGGWHILGFTPISLLSDELGIEPLLRAGDSVEFYPITKAAYFGWPTPHCKKISLQSAGDLTS